ncbi:MAG: nucleotidyltransferase family protein, partial [Methylocella sp.]
MIFKGVFLVQYICCRIAAYLPVETGRLLWYKCSMTRDEIIRTLKEREADLRAHGVRHAALFGSVARDEQRPGSDIDILVDLDPAIVATMFDYAGLKDYVASLFQGSVDV